MKVLYTAGLILSVGILSGCGESSSVAQSTSHNTISENSQVLVISGTDTRTLGGQMSLVDYDYSVAQDASFIVASGVLSDDPSSFLSIIAKPSAIAVSVLKDGEDWTYEFSCANAAESCDALAFDAENRTITFNDIQMGAYKNAVASSLSTAPLTLNGTITWNVADEVNSNTLAFAE